MPRKASAKKKNGRASTAKVEKVMREFKEGELHSGSKQGPRVSNRKQAIAIALSEARKAGEDVPKRAKKAQPKCSSCAKNMGKKRKK